MNMPKISVIMSTYNTEKEYLEKAIESILGQTYKNFEFIIVCDGSEKDLKILNNYNDDRIIIIKHNESRGLTKSLNEAIKIAKGKYIARMDSDDISLKNRFAIQVKYLEKNPNIDICSTFTKNFGSSKKNNINIYNNPEGVKAQLFLYNNIAHPTVMIRKEFLEKNNILYDETFRYSQDYELWTRCSKITNIYAIPKICLYYRMHNAQISTAKIEEQNKLCERVYLRNLEELNIENSKDKVKYMLYLNEKLNNNVNKEELLEFIYEVIENNKKKLIYDSKILERILLSKFLKINMKNIRKIEIKYILKSKIISTKVKKMFIILVNKIILCMKK